MLQRLLFGLITVAGLTLAGCAHSPQQLSPEPKLTTQLPAVGRGQPVVVRGLTVVRRQLWHPWRPVPGNQRYHRAARADPAEVAGSG